MPKLNPTHLPDRLKEAINQLEAGIEVEAKKNKTLLNAKQQQVLEDAWNEQQVLRKQHKPPKTEAEKKRELVLENVRNRNELLKRNEIEVKENKSKNNSILFLHIFQ